MELHKSHRHKNQGKQEIRHCHVDNEKVDWFSQSWPFVNDCYYQGISEKRKKEEDAKSHGYSNFVLCKIKRNRAARFIPRCIHEVNERKWCVYHCVHVG